MKLIKFMIKNFRSIMDGGEINLKDQFVLVGKNNEGKIIVLFVLKLVMDILKFYGLFYKSLGSVCFKQRNNYDWYRDFLIFF